MSAQQLISVVMPAYNAAATIDEALRSVRAQTWHNLEIIVVDDGSRDATPGIVRRHAAEDARVQLLTQANAGVAAARNLGIRAARSAYVAVIDSDDLWLPEKMALQRAAFDRDDLDVGLVYTWSAVIDEKSRVVSRHHRACHEGRVIEPLALSNFVHNGSSPMMLREAVLACGGYNTSLRERQAQGCEDYDLYFKLAERHDFAVVPMHLTGYRQTAGTMSGDAMQMLRSYELFVAPFRERYPQFAHRFAQGRTNIVVWLLRRAVLSNNWQSVQSLLPVLGGLNPLLLSRRLLGFASELLKLRTSALLVRSLVGRGEPFITAPGWTFGENRETR